MPKRILIVDDEVAICKMVERALRSETRETESVGSAEDALPRVANNSYDLYILDKNLPGMNGIDLAARVRAADRAAGILVLTGYASRESALQALHIGVDGYVEKPLMREALTERVEAALDAARNRRSLSGRLRTAREAARNALDQLDKPADSVGIVVAHPNLELATKISAQLGGEADTVTDLETLEARLAGPAPDLLLADTALSRDLTPTLRRAHERFPKLAIVVTGSPPSLQQVQALIFAGVRAVVEEPLLNGNLHERLARELANLRKP